MIKTILLSLLFIKSKYFIVKIIEYWFNNKNGMYYLNFDDLDSDNMYLFQAIPWG